VAARRPERSAENRIELAIAASKCHYDRTGRALYITRATVMGNEAFEDLEEPEQFDDPELKLPKGLTREGLWEEMRIVEQGEEGENEQALHEMFIGDPRYHPCDYHNGLGMNGMNGVLANGMGINGFAPAAINGLGVYPPNGPAVNGYLGEVGVDIALGMATQGLTWQSTLLLFFPMAAIPLHHGSWATVGMRRRWRR
jgi:hypothetical protein